MFAFASNTQEKVFGIGLSRTGTASLNVALQVLGFRTYHWLVPFEKRLVTLEDCFFCDGMTDCGAGGR